MANNKRKYSDEDEEEQERLKKEALASLLRKTNRPTTLNEIRASAVKNLPANIGMV